MSLPAVFTRLFLGSLLALASFLFLTPTTTQAYEPEQNQIQNSTQTQTEQYSPTNNYNSTPSFTTPNVDANVEQNQHTFVQAITIEIFAALICQLAGIDPVNPRQPCLGVNPQTNKLGYVSTQNQTGLPQAGGILGAAAPMMGAMYIPPATTGEYAQYLSSNFGIVKPAYAADGFTALRPLLQMWVGVRNIAYSFLILVFMLIGIGIMLRFRIDPRTVMTIQNQIPKVVVALIMITGSYAIAGAFVDLMWTATYAGINLITSAGSTNGGSAQLTTNPVIDKDTGAQLSKVASESLITTPLDYVGNVFQEDHTGFSDNGIYWIAWHVSEATGGIVNDALESIFIAPDVDCGWNPAQWGDCLRSAANAVMGNALVFLVNIITILIVIIALIVVLFRVWWMLLKAYISIIVFTIIAPVAIVLKLIPNGPFGIEWWLRRMLANFIVFPIVIWAIVAARVFIDSFKDQAQGGFVPPLIGNQNMENFGVLIGFGFLLALPTVVDTVRKSLKAASNPAISNTILAGIAAGAAAPRRGTEGVWNRATRRQDPARGVRPGWLRTWLPGAGGTGPGVFTRTSRGGGGPRITGARIRETWRRSRAAIGRMIFS